MAESCSSKHTVQSLTHSTVGQQNPLPECSLPPVGASSIRAKNILGPCPVVGNPSPNMFSVFPLVRVHDNLSTPSCLCCHLQGEAAGLPPVEGHALVLKPGGARCRVPTHQLRGMPWCSNQGEPAACPGRLNSTCYSNTQHTVCGYHPWILCDWVHADIHSRALKRS